MSAAELGDEVHVDIPVTLPDVWALEDEGAQVEVTRLARSGGGPACGHSAACLLLLPIVLVSLAFPEHYDLATVTRQDGLELSIVFETNGRFLWAVHRTGGWTRELSRLSLPMLGKSYIVERLRFREGDKGARTEETPTPIEPQTGVLAEYASAIAAADEEEKYGLYSEAIRELSDEAGPLLRSLSDPAQPDALLAKLIEETCVPGAQEPACRALLDAALVRRQLDSAIAALGAPAFERLHELPACDAERAAALVPQMAEYAFADGHHASQVMAAACQGGSLAVAADELGAVRVQGMRLGERVEIPHPPDLEDAPLTRVVIGEICEGARWAEALTAARRWIAERPARMRALSSVELGSGSHRRCSRSRLLVAKKAVGVAIDVAPVGALFRSKDPERLPMVDFLELDDPGDRALMWTALGGDAELAQRSLARLAQRAETGFTSVRTVEEKDGAVEAFARIEDCHLQSNCDYDVRAQANAVAILLSADPAVSRSPRSLELANAALERSVEDQAVASIPDLIDGNSGQLARLSAALDSLAPPERAALAEVRSPDQVTDRKGLIAFVLVRRGALTASAPREPASRLWGGAGE